jgi:hypothetical protein
MWCWPGNVGRLALYLRVTLSVIGGKKVYNLKILLIMSAIDKRKKIPNICPSLTPRDCRVWGDCGVIYADSNIR